MSLLLEVNPALLATYRMHDYDGGSGWWIVMFGLMILGVAAIFALVLAVLRRPGGDGAGESDEPLVIAQRRLARGEISTDEYQRLRNALEHSDLAPDK